MSKNLKLLVFPFIFQIFIAGWAYGASQKPRPIMPSPADVIYKETEPQPYTRLIQSRRFGEFYFTAEAEEDFCQYNRLCKILGLRQEITDKVKVSPIDKDQLRIQWTTPSDDLKEAVVNLKTTSVPESYIIDYPHEDYIIRVIVEPQRKYKVLLAECIAKYSMEIPMAGLVNEKKEITKLILPPADNVLLLDIDKNLVREYNRDNISLIKELDNPSLKADQKDSVIQHFVANAIYHPLGKFYLEVKGKKVVIAAEVAARRIIIPLECLSISLSNLIQKDALRKFFPDEEISNLSDAGILKLIYERAEEFPLRKDWYIITTPNTCFWTDYFTNYIEGELRLFRQGPAAQIPIHLHPWYSLQWLLDDPYGKYWLTQYRIHLVPSGKDIGFFKSRYPESRLYIILSKDIYSSELNWAVYDDLAGVEKALSELGSFEKDYRGGPLTEKEINRVRDIFAGLIKSQAAVTSYHIEQKKKLIVAPDIDRLLEINKKQSAILSLIDDYRKDYPWRLTNFSLIEPLLNKHLASYGWRVISAKKDLGSNITKKQFCYNPALNTRMDLALFIMSELCYINTKDFPAGVKQEREFIGILKDITCQLDYLGIKYYHFKEFCGHVRYLSHAIRYYIWEWEKAVLVAREQLQNGRRTLDKYNLGHYHAVSRGRLEILSEVSIDVTGRRIVELESLIKELSKTHSIKNEEEFVLEFERRLVQGILKKK